MSDHEKKIHKWRAKQAALTQSRKVSHEQKMAMGFVAVEVDGHIEYLSPLQERFCRFWVMQPNAPSRAAFQAGYGEHSKTDTVRWRSCHCVQYQLRKRKKIAVRYMELKKLADRGINIMPED